MEEISNNINNEPVTPTIELSPKQNNTFKILFIISILVVIGLIVTIVSLLKNPKQTTITETNIQTEETVIPTVAEEIISQQTTPKMENETKEANISAFIKTNGEKINVIINKDGKETIIDTINSSPVELFTYWVEDIKFTNSLKYLVYSVVAPERIVKIYDLKNNSFIKNGKSNGFITQSIDTPIITNDEKFLIYCSGGEYGGIDGAKIISLSDSTIKFDFIGYLGDKVDSPNISCKYYPKANTVNFYYKSGSVSKSIEYNLSTESIKAQ